MMFGAPKRRAAQQTAQDVSLPAPSGGLNANSAAMGMAPTECMLLFNMFPDDYGLRVRLGSREWAGDMDGASDDLVRTIIPYTGSNSDETRVWATTSTGIWDITESGNSSTGTEPTQVLAFSSSSGRAGHGIAHAQTTTAGNFLYYADEQNGLHVYTESTQTWAAPAGVAITGVDPADLVFVTVYKGFPFFAERDSTDLWFLDVGTVTGAASRLGIGYKLQAGGDIVGLWSWTYDGGSGLDDSLVVVSRGGDVVVFQGVDPSDSNLFSVQGVWGVGKMPAGRDLGTTFGGDLLLLTRMGILPMSKLVKGQTLESVEYETGKIQPLFNSLMQLYGDNFGWSMRLHPEEAALYVTVPTQTNEATIQLAMSMSRRGWTRIRGLDMFCCAPHEGKMYFGSTDGSVYINDGNVDGQPLDDPSDTTAIDYSGISAFQNLGSGRQKQVHLIKTYFLSESQAPSFAVNARYDFNLTELDAVTLAPASGAVWDTAVWDTDVWGGAYAPSSAVRGASGMGANVAIAWRGSASSRTVLTGFELSLSIGGML
jgi:hypothetical protein